MKPKATGWIAENADGLGVDTVWIGEDIGIGQETFILSAVTLMKTQQVRVGTGIIPMTIHNISTLARAALTLQEIGKGRFAFGTGIGGLQDLQKLGITLKKPVTELRSTVEILQKLWHGDSVSAETELHSLNDYDLRLKEPVEIPVFLGVRGPQMLRLTGTIAQGAILSGPFDYLRDATKILDTAAKKAGRAPSAVEKVAWLPTIPTFKGGKEILAKRVVAIVVGDMPEKVLDLIDMDREKLDRIRIAVAASGPKEGAEHVDQEVIDMFAIAGGREHMVDQFENLSKLGMTEVVLGPPFSGDWRGAMTEIFDEIVRRKA
jgi:alkanesulfonate monooxygenase SsuD/methylene tetrahydromethanopterin reductase-like flavin-dependent oxidoreductase (luciferase family)